MRQHLLQWRQRHLPLRQRLSTSSLTVAGLKGLDPRGPLHEEPLLDPVPESGKRAAFGLDFRILVPAKLVLKMFRF